MSSTEKGGKTGKLKWIVAAVLFVGITVAAIPIMQYMVRPEFQQGLKAWVGDAGIGGVALLFGVQLLQILVAVIPGEPIEVVAGAMYGIWGGLAVCLVGILVGSASIFWVVRRLGRERLRKTKIYPKLMQYDFLASEQKLQAMVLLLYLIPGTPKDMLVYVCALTGISMRSFLTISTLARIPSVITSTMAGATFMDGNHLLTVGIFVATGLAGLLGILYNNKRFGKSKKGTGGKN